MKISKYLNCFKGLLIYLILSPFLEIIISRIIHPYGFWFSNIANLIAPVVTTLVLVIVFQDFFKEKFKDFQKNCSQYLSLIIKYWLVGYIFMTITNLLISSITGNIAINEENNRTLFNSLPLYSIISTIFLAPICEELAFRASLKGISNNKNVVCLISALIFGLMHVIFNGDFLHSIPYILMGFFLAKAYFETDNILCSITMHSWHNFFCIILLILGDAI